MATASGKTTHGQPQESYRYLEQRPESWRRQLFIKGRNIPAGHVVRSMLANQRTPRQEAEDRELPVEAVYECLRYYDDHEADVLADIQAERESALRAGIELD